MAEEFAGRINDLKVVSSKDCCFEKTKFLFDEIAP